MSKRIVKTDRAPGALGVYSQGVIASGFVFTAGQLGLDPQTGEFVPGGVQEQTRQALLNISAVLEAAGSSLGQVVKTTVFLDSMDDFAAMNEIYQQFFTSDPPARSTVEVARLPRNALVEIETVALV